MQVHNKAGPARHNANNTAGNAMTPDNDYFTPLIGNATTNNLNGARS